MENSPEESELSEVLLQSNKELLNDDQVAGASSLEGCESNVSCMTPLDPYEKNHSDDLHQEHTKGSLEELTEEKIMAGSVESSSTEVVVSSDTSDVFPISFSQESPALVLSGSDGEGRSTSSSPSLPGDESSSICFSEGEGEFIQKVVLMEQTLAGATPRFKQFWAAHQEAHRLLQKIEKERICDWAEKYQQLTNEARRLKVIFDKQSAFASEQMKIAIEALQADLNKQESYLEGMPVLEEELFPEESKSSMSFYCQLQKEVALLEIFATRLTDLRVELTKSAMRIPVKNQFFRQLSALGDQIFPLKKQKSEELSARFSEDVHRFIERKASPVDPKSSFVSLKEEVKSFQKLAKLLPLSYKIIALVRGELTKVWEQLKELETQWKEERAQRREESSKQGVELKNRARELKEKIEGGEISTGEAKRGIDSLLSSFSKLHSSKEQQREFRDILHALQQPLLEKIRIEEEHRQQAAIDRVREKKEIFDNLKRALESLQTKITGEKIAEIASNIENCRSVIREKSKNGLLSEHELNEVERLLKRADDLLVRCQEEQLLIAAGGEASEKLRCLHELLQQRKERRKQVEAHCAAIRRETSRSGLDFSQAISGADRLLEEKQRLEGIEREIRETEQVIRELEKEIRNHA